MLRMFNRLQRSSHQKVKNRISYKVRLKIYLIEQIGEIMNEEADEYNDENADKYIQEVEAKIAGAGNGGGG